MHAVQKTPQGSSSSSKIHQRKYYFSPTILYNEFHFIGTEEDSPGLQEGNEYKS